jgi:hypothetical protein
MKLLSRLDHPNILELYRIGSALVEKSRSAKRAISACNRTLLRSKSQRLQCAHRGAPCSMMMIMMEDCWQAGR